MTLAEATTNLIAAVAAESAAWTKYRTTKSRRSEWRAAWRALRQAEADYAEASSA